jgi:hypothetical protein
VTDVAEPDEAELARWQEEFLEHRRRYPAPDPLPPLSLRDLWPRVSFPSSLRIREARANDLYFDLFAISQRFVNEVRSPEGSMARHYFVAIPTGTSSFRCVAQEISGRHFCTVQQHRRCSPPDADDFGIVRVRRSDAFQLLLYLPSRYGKWTLLRNPEYEDESV